MILTNLYSMLEEDNVYIKRCLSLGEDMHAPVEQAPQGRDRKKGEVDCPSPI
jgi:hypothetical protein